MSDRARLVLVTEVDNTPPDIQFDMGVQLSDPERSFLSTFLSNHPDGQLIADELAGQIRLRGRGRGGIRNPRALAALLAREATTHGTHFWYNHQEENERRKQPTPSLKVKTPEAETTRQASPETLAAARAEAQKIKERHAASRLKLVEGGKK